MLVTPSPTYRVSGLPQALFLLGVFRHAFPRKVYFGHVLTFLANIGRYLINIYRYLTNIGRPIGNYTDFY